MSGRNTGDDHLDTLSSRFLVGLAQRSSRRGVLARLGKIALGLLGVSVLPNLPLDRIFKVQAQAECNALELCGIWGWLCNSGASNCCNGGVGSSGCPSCTSRGYFAWSVCCPSGGQCIDGFYIDYWDCCGGGAGAAGCTGTKCTNNPVVQPQWCAGGDYRCTIAVVTYEPCNP